MKAETLITTVHIFISFALISIVLSQEAKQEPSVETTIVARSFFSKNKKHNYDSILKKITAFIASLFIISSIFITVYMNNKTKNENHEKILENNFNQEKNSEDTETKEEQQEENDLTNDNKNLETINNDENTKKDETNY
ncbi:MAG: preprotein translocase subunit SecG [Clostridiales bacterium]|nr:preprotein translocase subunit SecG [Clostridiales bacterium]